MQNKLYVISGAGLSAESGLSTFRSADGLWSKHSLERVCNFLTWKDNKEEVFAFYNARKKDGRNAVPNAAHLKLAEWQARYGADRVVLLTQNVDMLLEQAGATEVVHLHGDMEHMQCYGCGNVWNIGQAEFDVAGACPKCGCLRAVKPAVVFFNEHAPRYASLKKMRDALTPDDIVLVVGSAMQVLPANQLIPSRRRDLSRNIQVNPDPADAWYFGHNIAMPATAGLPHVEPLIEALMLGTKIPEDWTPPPLVGESIRPASGDPAKRPSLSAFISKVLGG